MAIFRFSFYVRTAHGDWVEDLGKGDVFGMTVGTGLRARLPAPRAVLSKVVEYTDERRSARFWLDWCFD